MPPVCWYCESTPGPVRRLPGKASDDVTNMDTPITGPLGQEPQGLQRDGEAKAGKPSNNSLTRSKML
eukprot:8617292-Alexandrium_andersonii.AAC.1